MKAGKSKSYPCHLIKWIGGKTIRCTKKGASGGSKFDTWQAKLRKENEAAIKDARARARGF